MPTSKSSRRTWKDRTTGKTPGIRQSWVMRGIKFQCLIVDENFFNLYAMKQLLQQFQGGSELAMTGKEAVSMVKKNLIQRRSIYDLIILDYNTPDLNAI